jgi:hypothetical protein
MGVELKKASSSVFELFDLIEGGVFEGSAVTRESDFEDAADSCSRKKSRAEGVSSASAGSELIPFPFRNNSSRSRTLMICFMD